MVRPVTTGCAPEVLGNINDVLTELAKPLSAFSALTPVSMYALHGHALGSC
ncbi:MAG TPA: hypothetical protein PLM14_17505 [Candidatus Hydrogenedentes bacterium]|nr:hypothetical protein [Candidatus Hydrogenedentota bacterium]HQE84798.1 hypothetical protein [Candidatus Hydrogenedentota bacterium]HQH54464.1 hypothetical protein [Candidatus Hydrogenedentota bacterium]HQM51371.1 hypothetical protein [Candidatus Hydrogenedentota bacterium]